MVTSENDMNSPIPDSNWPEKFNELQTCVIIPTYNNARTLGKTIEDVSAYTRNILVINDGSTDDTDSVIRKFPFVKSIAYPSNRGKGRALRMGFRYAVELGYQYAISIDSDGQHFAKDLPLFLRKLESEGASIIIGARNMAQETVPGKSSFGHKFSNFWFTVETGIKAPDTQSGYRLYPVGILRNMRFFTRKYEFEIEVLVRAAWKGIPVLSVPVSVYYPPADQRISHFRPFRDFTRISILNTMLVLITFLYIRPRDFFRELFLKKNWQELLSDLWLNPGQSDLLKASSIGFGVFMGIVPIWGFQLAVAIFLAIAFKLNKALVIIAANISIPPMIPLILFCSFKMGAIWMPGSGADIRLTRDLSLASIRFHLQQYMVGSISLAILAGLIFTIASFGLLKLFRKRISPLPQNQ